MTTRKNFIAAAAAVPLLGATPPPPAPTPKKGEVSQAARGLAAQMRRFDSALSDEELEQIAVGIDENLKVGDKVNPHGRALKNWDEPVTVFEVEE